MKIRGHVRDGWTDRIVNCGASVDFPLQGTFLASSEREMDLGFLRPSSLSQRHLLSRLGTGPVDLAPPGPVLAEARLGIGGVVEVDLRDLCLDESPDTPGIHISATLSSWNRSFDCQGRGASLPVEAWNTTESIDVLEELVDSLVHRRLRQTEMLVIALDVLFQELPSDRSRGQHVIIAVIAAPLREMVRDIEGGGRRDGIFVVDEVDSLSSIFIRGAILCLGQDDHVGAEQVTVGKHQLLKTSEDILTEYLGEILSIRHLLQYLPHRRVRTESAPAPSAD